MARDGDDLRRALAEAPVLMPGVWDALTTRLAADAGFGTVFLSGFCAAAAHLAAPDIGLWTQTEMAELARRVAGAVPEATLVVDADTGYGDALNVARTVELWEAAGAAGLFLEDQVWPKRCGHMAGKQVVDTDDWLARLRAAPGARTRLFVCARTDARAVHGLEEAIDRARRAADLGVDAVFVEAPTSVDELTAVAAALPGVTLVANMVEGGVTPLLDRRELDELGFRLVVAPVGGLLAAVQTLERTYTALAAEGTLRGHLADLAPFASVPERLGLEHLRARQAAATDPV